MQGNKLNAIQAVTDMCCEHIEKLNNIVKDSLIAVINLKLEYKEKLDNGLTVDTEVMLGNIERIETFLQEIAVNHESSILEMQEGCKRLRNEYDKT